LTVVKVNKEERRHVRETEDMVKCQEDEVKAQGEVEQGSSSVIRASTSAPKLNEGTAVQQDVSS